MQDIGTGTATGIVATVVILVSVSIEVGTTIIGGGIAGIITTTITNISHSTF